MKKKIRNLIFILILMIISSLPILFKNDAIVQGHDLNFHLHRILGVVDNISILKIIPVYYNYLNHFGYGNGLFYPDLFIYIPGILYKLGISLINSYKIFILIINLFSIISIKVCLKHITKDEKITKIGMILYATSLYRFADMYLRSALGESITFAFLPLVILGLYAIFYDDCKKGYYLTIGLIGLMSSHIITTYMIAYFIIFFIIMNYKCLKEKERLKELIIQLVFSVLITSFFWMPMIEQLLIDKFNIDNYIKIFENCVPLWHIIIDFEDMTEVGWFPPGIGLIYFIIIPFFIKTKKKSRFINNIFIIGIGSTLLSSLKILWKIPLIYKLFSIIQFPWRLQSISTICFIIVTCYFFNNTKNNKLIKITVIYTLFIFLVNCLFVYFFPTMGNNLYSDGIMYGEYLPIELKDNYKDIMEKYTNEKITYKYENEKLIVDVIKKADDIELPLIYYKGYIAKSNENNLKITKSDKGLVKIKIKNDIKRIIISYEGTTIKEIGEMITIISTLFYFIIVKRSLKKINNK